MSSTQEAAATFNDATPASPETPIDEQETPSGDLIFSEGQLVLADNVIVQTHFVQLKEAPVFQWPQDLPVLVKGCPAEHAIENGARLRLSKPEVFRYDDGTRIGDPFEGVTQREERRVDRVAVDDPDDSKRARQRSAEHNALAAAIGSKRHQTTTGTRTETSTTNRDTHTYGKNGWILCASLRPPDETGLQQSRDSLDPQYDHVTTIQNPTDFARELAGMVASQLGPRGGPMTFTHGFSKQKTTHPSQSVFHGPVAYVDDPYAYVASAANPLETMLRSAFFKHTRFRHQREYRFVVWCENEPDDLIVYLAVSQGMRDSLAIADEQPPSSQLDDDDPQGAACVSAHIEEAVEGLSPPLHDEAQPSSQEQPATGVGSRDESDRPDGHDHDGTAVPIPIAVAMRMAQLPPRLRQIVLDADDNPQAAAAAFHATSPLESLLATFVDPVSNVEWRDGGLMITLNMPPGSDKEGQLALGAHGTGQYRFGNADEFTEVRCVRGWMLVDALVTDLEQQGLIRWSQIPDEGVMIRLSEPGPASEPRVSSKYSAEIHRTTTTALDTVDGADIDRINAQEPRSADDARISKVVIDGGPGHIVKLHGTRDGLLGVATQRTNVDSVTITVETINPDASVEVNAPDARPEAGGHEVALPEGEDTSIRITATAPDGVSTSHLKIVLKRSSLPGEKGGECE